MGEVSFPDVSINDVDIFPLDFNGKPKRGDIDFGLPIPYEDIYTLTIHVNETRMGKHYVHLNINLNQIKQFKKILTKAEKILGEK